MEKRQNLPQDLPISQSGDCSQRSRQAIRQLNPPPPPSLVWRLEQESLRDLAAGWQRIKP